MMHVTLSSSHGTTLKLDDIVTGAGSRVRYSSMISQMSPTSVLEITLKKQKTTKPSKGIIDTKIQQESNETQDSKKTEGIISIQPTSSPWGKETMKLAVQEIVVPTQGSNLRPHKLPWPRSPPKSRKQYRLKRVEMKEPRHSDFLVQEYGSVYSENKVGQTPASITEGLSKINFSLEGPPLARGEDPFQSYLEQSKYRTIVPQEMREHSLLVKQPNSKQFRNHLKHRRAPTYQGQTKLAKPGEPTLSFSNLDPKAIYSSSGFEAMQQSVSTLPMTRNNLPSVKAGMSMSSFKKVTYYDSLGIRIPRCISLASMTENEKNVDRNLNEMFKIKDSLKERRAKLSSHLSQSVHFLHDDLDSRMEETVKSDKDSLAAVQTQTMPNKDALKQAVVILSTSKDQDIMRVTGLQQMKLKSLKKLRNSMHSLKQS